MKLLLLIAIIFSTNIYANKVKKNNESIIKNNTFSKIKDYWSRIKFSAEYNSMTYQKDYIGINEESTIESKGYSIGISLPIAKNFAFNFLYPLSNISEYNSKETNRDEDIYDANNKKIRLVERSITYHYSEKTAPTFLLDYSHPISKKFIVAPYVGFSTSSGTVNSERYDMTDRDKPILFSKHNRYTLSSDSQFKRKNIIIGSRLYYRNRYFLNLSYTLSKIKFSNTNQSISTSGETIAFDSDDFYFEKFHSNQEFSDSLIAVGIGIYF